MTQEEHIHRVGRYYVKDSARWLLFAVGVIFAAIILRDPTAAILGITGMILWLAMAGQYKARITNDGLRFERRNEQ